MKRYNLNPYKVLYWDVEELRFLIKLIFVDNSHYINSNTYLKMVLIEMISFDKRLIQDT